MSSESADDVTGKQDQQRGIVPTLRFPEFRGAWGWDDTTIGEVGTFYYGKSAPKWSLEENAPTKCVRYGELYTKFGPVITETLSRTNIDPKNLRFSKGGEILVPRVGEKPEDFGKCCSYLTLPNIAIGEMISVFETDQNALFYTYYFRRLYKEFAKVVEGQNVKNLYYSELEPLAIGRPTKPEQQKIADCLSSIDALIAAELEKLGMLKDHKRGLMQQLFPAPGETTPRLRFPEFRDAGDWKFKTINEIADLHKGKGISKSDIAVDGNLDCIRYGELYTSYGEVIYDTLSKTNLLPSELFMSKKNDVIIPSSGETKIDIATASCVMRNDIALGGDLNVIRSGQNGVFLSYFLNGPLKLEIAKVAQGDSVVHLYATQIGLLQVAIPTSREQQTIATCLSSIDTRIATQSTNIDALKVHKQGLMQQLFPMAYEVQA